MSKTSTTKTRHNMLKFLMEGMCPANPVKFRSTVYSGWWHKGVYRLALWRGGAERRSVQMMKVGRVWFVLCSTKSTDAFDPLMTDVYNYYEAIMLNKIEMYILDREGIAALTQYRMLGGHCHDK